MKKILVSIALFLGLMPVVMSQETVRYGYCPEQISLENMSALGTGKNKFIEGAICLDPTSDPVLKRMQGVQLKGVRVYMQADYKQAAQGRSFIEVRKNSLEAEAEKKICNFKSGWNEIYFDNPVIIGQEKLYVGLQVFETVGSPYPLIAANEINVPGGCWVNMGREGWKEMNDRGTLFIQALVDETAAQKLERSIYAQIVKNPLTVLPEQKFNARVYIQNLSATPVQTLTLETLGKGDDTPDVQQIQLETALEAYNGRVIDLSIRAGKEPGVKQEITLTVTQMNGEPTQEARVGKSFLYITEDAFVRIPVVEEFTSQYCPNCPFMIYYVDKAREAYDGPLLYITHHTGYTEDSFTLPQENEMHYMFGEVGPFNPAIMYDRLLFQGESALPMASTGVTSEQPYLEKFKEVEQRPAMAQIFVDANLNDGKLTARVYGRINKDQAASGEQLYLTAYVMEDNIPLDKYPQLGLDADGAPEDLVSGFRHNGIIRHSYTKNILGDELTIAEDATFSVDFSAIDWNTDWNWDNSQVVAFIHKMDKNNLANNEILNGGSNRYNQIVGIDNLAAEKNPSIKFLVGSDRIIRTETPVKTLRVYNLSGSLCNNGSALSPGIYIAHAITTDGSTVAQKVIVR